MTKRSNTVFPFKTDLSGFLKDAWENGWFDEYSDEHFLIKAIENRTTSTEWDTQLLLNNPISMYSPICPDGRIDYNMFSQNFITNLSFRLIAMKNTFGENKIRDFIENQLSAGKNNYSQDSFFQALSEIEILSFYCRHDWTKAEYEPKIGKNGENPEASFEKAIEDTEQKIKINIEVKTPKFPIIDNENPRIAIPTVLLTDKGRNEVLELCKKNVTKCTLPRVTKLVEFINSAAKKFNKPKDGEYNLLYINWSYSDFPSNGFLEPWSLLSNEINGILTHPEIGTNLPFNAPICKDAYEKITAIIVYTSSIEQLMFSDFKHVWQCSKNAKHRFRMLVLDNKLKEDELSGKSDVLFNITNMNPDLPEPKKWRMLISNGWSPTTPEKQMLNDVKFNMDLLEIIENNILLEL